MKIDYSNEKPKFERKRKGDMPNLIHEFLEKDERVMTLTYDTDKECNTAYQCVYAYTQRRHNVPIKRYKDGNKLILEKIDGYTNDYGQALDDLVERLECIDPCDFAMYSLELVKENVRELKEYRDEQR